MSTPESPGDSCDDCASKQGILSFFQNIKAKRHDIIEVTDSDNEKTTAGNKEPTSTPLQSWLKDAEQKKGQLHTMEDLKEVLILPDSTVDEKRKEKEQGKQKCEGLKEKKVRKQVQEEFKRQEEVAKRQHEVEKSKIENEKKAREDEKGTKEEAKEKSQSRINNFFKKVTDSNKPTFVQSDYEEFFLPFYSKEGVVTSPSNQLPSAELNENRNRIDSLIIQKKNDDQVIQWLNSRLHSVKISLPIAYQATSLLQQMTSKEKSDKELQSLLSLIPQKYIKFYENVRPPYMGTYSKDVVLPANDPFSTGETGYNYGFDSDLEWANEEEEEVEGGVENLESGEEEEEEEEEENEGEFDEFLDPEERNGDVGNKSCKRKFIGPLIPKVCLQEKPEQMDDDDRRYFNMVAIQYLIEEQPFPINPNQCVKHHVEAVSRTLVDSQNDLSTLSTSPEKRKPLISEPKDLLRLFHEIQDSTFSLGTVTEIAQKNLPLYSKQIIKNTVKEYAVRTNLGTSRRWTIKNPQYFDQLRSDCNNIK